MSRVQALRKQLSQIYAITEKEIKLQLRFKLNLIFSFITPIITIIMPLIVMGTIFNYNVSLGEWDANNFVVYQFIAYHIALLRVLLNAFAYDFRQEKYWYTLQSIIIAPFNRINLLLGIFSAQIILILFPFAFILGICYFFYPISFATLLFIFLIYFLIALIFSGVGIILGILAISIENYWSIFRFLIYIIFWFSCISYPFELFPKVVQNIINANPFYYIFDVLRLTWIENNIIYTFTTHPFNLFLLISLAISLPLIGVYIFNVIYKKYGIVGY